MQKETSHLLEEEFERKIAELYKINENLNRENIKLKTETENFKVIINFIRWSKKTEKKKL